MAAAAIIFALVASTFFANGYQLFVLSLVGLTAIVGIGLNILLGLTGQISLGHVGFYAIGAYAVGILTTTAHMNFRSEEHTSELQSLMRISYAVFCLKQKLKHNHLTNINS